MPRAALLLVLLARPAALEADDLAAALYVRSDSDDTTVISPHARASRTVAESTQVEASYAADVWTSASIDIRTSASVRPVTEQRDELDLGVTHESGDLALHAAYRLSIENDYESHGLSAGASIDLADNAATLDLGLGGFHDVVGRSGDPEFARALNTLDARIAFTQVIDPDTLSQLTYELALLDGYQASPYRFVGIGGTGFGCVAAVFCLSERAPETRMRHALAVLLQRALGQAVSATATYRYYTDDWNLDSHTVQARLAWSASDVTLIAVHYRFYTQGYADFYRTRYVTLPVPGEFFTRDRELSPLAYHRIGADLEGTFELDGGAKRLSATLALAGGFFRYDAFVGLQNTSAVEVTTALVLSM